MRRNGRPGEKRCQEPFVDAATAIGYSAGMGRPHRVAAGGYVYHVLNRANARMTMFADPGEYEAFEHVLAEAVERTGTRLLRAAAPQRLRQPLLPVCRHFRLLPLTAWRRGLSRRV